MANRCRCRRVKPDPPVPQTVREPSVRRWPHPIAYTVPEASDPMLHYIRCALSYQNEMLAEIKTLLEQIAENTSPADNAGT